MTNPIIGAVYEYKDDRRYKIRILGPALEIKNGGGGWFKCRNLDSGILVYEHESIIEDLYELEQA